MRQIILGVLLAGLSAAASYDLTSQAQATLASAQTATGPSTNEANFGFSGRRGAALFQFRNAGSASGTVELQVNCLTGNTDWATIPNSSSVLAAGANAALDIARPGCRYRANVTACSAGCSLTATVTSIGQ